MLKKSVLFYILSLSLSLTPNINAQETTQETELIFANPEILPQFVGGMDEFSKFFNRKYVMPSHFKGSGVATVAFVIEKDGSLSNIKVINNLGYGTTKELLRVFNLSPKWKPGKIQGNSVRSSYRVPITLVRT